VNYYFILCFCENERNKNCHNGNLIGNKFGQYSSNHEKINDNNEKISGLS